MTFERFLVLLISASLVRCATNGMDMDMDDSMTMTMANMTTYLHFTPGDNLWIYGWSTTNSRAMGAACLGMFMLALFERWLAANRGALEGYWAREARHLEKKGSLKNDSTTSASGEAPGRRAGIKLVPGARSHIPFAWSIDPVRGLIHAVQTGLGFTLMLVVMTFQLSFILSLVIGSALGQFMYGRYTRTIGVGSAALAGLGGH